MLLAIIDPRSPVPSPQSPVAQSPFPNPQSPVPIPHIPIAPFIPLRGDPEFPIPQFPTPRSMAKLFPVHPDNPQIRRIEEIKSALLVAQSCFILLIQSMRLVVI